MRRQASEIGTSALGMVLQIARWTDDGVQVIFALAVESMVVEFCGSTREGRDRVHGGAGSVFWSAAGGKLGWSLG